MIRPVTCIALLILIATSACDVLVYDPKGDHFVEVSPTSTPLVIDFSSAADTLGLWGTVTLEYSLETSGRPLGGLNVYLDDDLIASSQSSTSVTFSTEGIADGEYALRVEARTRSGTGSVADVLGEEVTTAEASRVAIVDNAPPDPVESLVIGPADGTLRASWSQYRRHNFQTYRVYRVAEDGTRSLEAEIDDPRVASWDEQFFLGGHIRLAVDILAAGHVTTGDPVGFEAPLPSLYAADPAGDGGIMLQWTPTGFPANLESYQVLRIPLVPSGINFVSYVPGTSEVVATITDPTAVGSLDIPSYRFAQRYRYRLIARPQGGNHSVKSHMEASADRRADIRGRNIVYLSSNDSFVGRSATGEEMIRVDGTTFERVAAAGPRVDFPVTADPKGSAVMTAHQSTLHVRDPASLEVVRAINLESLVGDNPIVMPGNPRDGILPMAYPRLTNTGVYAFSLGRFRSPTHFISQGAHTIRLEPTSYVGGIARDNHVHLVSSTHDLRYLLTHESRYHVFERDASSSTGYVHVRQISGYHEHAGVFFVGEATLATVSTTGQVRIEDAETGMTITEFEVSPLRGPRYYEAGQVIHGLSDDGTIRGYFVNNGQLAFDVRSDVRYASAYSIAGGTLWHDGHFRRILP